MERRAVNVNQKMIDDIIVKKKMYKSPDYSAQKLADELGLSIFQLSRLLKNIYGKSYAEIVLPLRIKEAKKLLEDPKKAELVMEDIGVLVGFKNTYSFFIAFKKYAGTTPNEWKKQKHE